MSTKTTKTTFKTPLLNDCTNHLAFQLEQHLSTNQSKQKKRITTHETALPDVVTTEFIRGYN